MTLSVLGNHAADAPFWKSDFQMHHKSLSDKRHQLLSHIERCLKTSPPDYPAQCLFFPMQPWNWWFFLKVQHNLAEELWENHHVLRAPKVILWRFPVVWVPPNHPFFSMDVPWNLHDPASSLGVAAVTQETPSAWCQEWCHDESRACCQGPTGNKSHVVSEGWV